MGDDFIKGIWENILTKIKGDNGNCFCIPFLGAGANAPGDKYEGLPLGANVAYDMARKMEISLFKWKELSNNMPDLIKERFQKNFRINWLNNADIKNMDDRTIIISDRFSEQNFILISLNSDKTKIELTYLLCWKDIIGLQDKLKMHLNLYYGIDLSKADLNVNQGGKN